MPCVCGSQCVTWNHEQIAQDSILIHRAEAYIGRHRSRNSSSLPNWICQQVLLFSNYFHYSAQSRKLFPRERTPLTRTKDPRSQIIDGSVLDKQRWLCKHWHWACSIATQRRFTALIAFSRPVPTMSTDEIREWHKWAIYYLFRAEFALKTRDCLLLNWSYGLKMSFLVLRDSILMRRGREEDNISRLPTWNVLYFSQLT